MIGAHKKASKQHTRVHNAVTLVWSSLSLASNYYCNLVLDRTTVLKLVEPRTLMSTQVDISRLMCVC